MLKLLGFTLVIVSKLLVFRKMRRMQTVSGISLKSNTCMLIGYVLQFSNPKEWSDVSLYHLSSNLCKIAMLEYQIGIIVLILFKYNKTYDKQADKMSIWILMLISLGIGLLGSIRRGGFIEAFWCVGVVLESLSVIPQLVMMQESGDCESMNGRILFYYSTGKTLNLVDDIGRGRVFNSLIGLFGLALVADFIRVYYKHIRVNIEEKFRRQK
ncbi:ERD2 [Enterospora canceri]|uniref:ERD2 n=1 Tax=Enterospora canceri TaxID=1081671 RepID=A0A1Y1S6H0_9MICR|nr:ERD2 [Enterospora canceri]